MAKQVIVICPNCNGKGTTTTHGHGAFGEPETMTYTCECCKGAKEVKATKIRKVSS